jgi:hypothetical protein
MSEYRDADVVISKRGFILCTKVHRIRMTVRSMVSFHILTNTTQHNTNRKSIYKHD